MKNKPFPTALSMLSQLTRKGASLITVEDDIYVVKFNSQLIAFRLSDDPAVSIECAVSSDKNMDISASDFHPSSSFAFSDDDASVCLIDESRIIR